MIGDRAALAQLTDDLASELRRLSRNAARRNKPTMWAYYLEMADWLERFRGASDLLGILSGYARIEPFDTDQRPSDTARRWAQGIYARRILRAAGFTSARPSLDWLRNRAA